LNEDGVISTVEKAKESTVDNFEELVMSVDTNKIDDVILLDIIDFDKTGVEYTEFCEGVNVEILTLDGGSTVIDGATVLIIVLIGRVFNDLEEIV
jgi:hypothetical protein